MPSFYFLPQNRRRPLSRKDAAPRSLVETGQTLAILAIMMLALVAFVGLASDGAILYITYGQLRRATDAAALSAAAQLREARTDEELDRTVQETMQLQGIVAPVHIGNTDELGAEATDGVDNDGDGCIDDPGQLCFVVQTCERVYGAVPEGFDDVLIDTDPVICTFPARKLVRVNASTSAEFVFMRLWGWNRVQLNATATSEAAALDVMLVLDVSYSMTWDATLSNGFDDDGDGCVDEAADESGCATFNGHADDWLGSKATGNGVVNPLASPGVLPDTTPNCNTAGAASTIAYLQGANRLPASWMADLNGDSVGETAIAPLTPCRPFEYVRDAALRFVSTYVDFPYDRVGIITFASAPCPPGRTYATCATNQTTVRQSIGDGDDLLETVAALQDGGVLSYGTLDRLEVSARPPCHGDGSQRWSPNDLYPNLWDGGEAGTTAGDPDAGDFGECENTDTGDGLLLAFDDLNSNRRSNAVRFIILLSDGAASTSAYNVATNYDPDTYACPNERRTATLQGGSPNPFYDQYFGNRPCQDGDSRNFYVFRHDSASGDYDADDYARDQADEIADAGNTIIFAIGLGAEVTNNPDGGGGCSVDVYGTLPDSNSGNPDCLPNGEQLLRYIADQGDGINPPDPDPCGRDDTPGIADPASPTAAELAANPIYSLYTEPVGSSCGNYFYAPGGLNVRAVFDEIAQRIFTRLTQ
ncbi:MAG: VWA domain-containing protein [Chloroflexi bacterium]|nr:VWA domain-containing protein [Chloroflexota bacterium]